MSLPDLCEVGPDGEEWWALDAHTNGVHTEGHVHALFFTTMEDMISVVAFYSPKLADTGDYTYRQILARTSELIDPCIFYDCRKNGIRAYWREK